MLHMFSLTFTAFALVLAGYGPVLSAEAVFDSVFARGLSRGFGIGTGAWGMSLLIVCVYFWIWYL